MYCNSLELIFAAFGTSSQIPETARTAGRCDRRGARTTPRLCPAFSPQRPKSLDFDHFQRFSAFAASGFPHCRSCQYEHFPPTLPHVGAASGFWVSGGYAPGCARKIGHSRDTRLTRANRYLFFMCASRLPFYPETKLLLRYDKPAADPQRRKAVLVQKLIGTRRRNAQRAGDKLRV